VTTESPMPKISLRLLLARLTVLALTAAPAAANARIVNVIDDEHVLDANLPIDREHVPARDAALLLSRGLAHALGELPALHATQLATTWALSEDPLRRNAVARALEWMFPLLGDSIVIDHLSYDPDPAIRVAVARAAWVRRATGGDPGVLERLATDEDPEVRAVALRARPTRGV
jgi:hypothetical protein